MSDSSLTPPDGSLKPLSESDQREMGKQLTEQYERTQLAALEIVAFGAMFNQIEEQITVSARGHGGKFGDKGTGMKAWLAKYAEGVARSNAYRYRDIAEAMRTELCLKSHATLQLVASPDKNPTLEPKLAKKRVRLIAIVSDKSVRGLQAELGLVDESAPHAPAKKLTPAERHASWIAAARASALEAFNGVHILGERWKLLTDDQLALAHKNATKLAKEIERWLATDPSKRAALHVAKYLGEGEST